MCVLLQPHPLPTQLIRKATTVIALVVVQRRFWLASGTWDFNTNSLFPFFFPSFIHWKSNKIILWREAKLNGRWLGDYLPKTNMLWWIWSNLQHKVVNSTDWKENYRLKQEVQLFSDMVFTFWTELSVWCTTDCNNKMLRKQKMLEAFHTERVFGKLQFYSHSPWSQC